MGFFDAEAIDSGRIIPASVAGEHLRLPARLHAAIRMGIQ